MIYFDCLRFFAIVGIPYLFSQIGIIITIFVGIIQTLSVINIPQIKTFTSVTIAYEAIYTTET